jgi:hypothetical protein
VVRHLYFYEQKVWPGGTSDECPGIAKPWPLCATKMRAILTFIFLLLGRSAFAQTIESIDSLIQIINQTANLDTISISNPKIAITKPVKVKAFLKGDTLLKTIASYANSSRQRITYYDYTYQGYSTPLYIKDIDSLTNDVWLEVFGKDNKVIKSTIVNPLDEHEKVQPSNVMQNANFSIEIGFALVDRKAEKYSFTGRLTETVPLTPGCGRLAWAIVQKFEVLRTTFPNYDEKYVLIIQACPEFLKKGFFQKDRIYELSVATNSGVTFPYSVINSYQNEKLPSFWTRQVKRTN